jgi:hypothetical protein
MTAGSNPALRTNFRGQEMSSPRSRYLEAAEESLKRYRELLPHSTQIDGLRESFENISLLLPNTEGHWEEIPGSSVSKWIEAPPYL